MKKNKSILELNKIKINKILSFQKKQGFIDLNNFKSIINEQQKNDNEFKFDCEISKNNNLYIIEFKGKHYAKNVIQNRWHRGILLKYKKSIKEAAKNAFIYAQINNVLPKEPLNNVSIKIEVYNPKSRDDDANYDTLKWIRDTFTVNKLLIDDNRSVIKHTEEKEIISKEWKIVFSILDLSN